MNTNIKLGNIYRIIFKFYCMKNFINFTILIFYLSFGGCNYPGSQKEVCEASTLDVRINECKKKYKSYIDFKTKYVGEYSITGLYLDNVLSNDSLSKYKIKSIEIQDFDGQYFCKRKTYYIESNCLEGEDIPYFEIFYINGALKGTKLLTKKEIISESNNTYKMEILSLSPPQINIVDILKFRTENTKTFWIFKQKSNTEFVFENESRTVKLELKK